MSGSEQQVFPAWLGCVLTALAVWSGAGAWAQGSSVKVEKRGGSYLLQNAYVTAEVDRTTGDLKSLKYRGLEMMGYTSGHHAGYWEQNPSGAGRADRWPVDRPGKQQWRSCGGLHPGQGTRPFRDADEQRHRHDLRPRNPLCVGQGRSWHLHLCDLFASGELSGDRYRREPVWHEAERRPCSTGFRSTRGTTKRCPAATTGTTASR